MLRLHFNFRTVALSKADEIYIQSRNRYLYHNLIVQNTSYVAIIRSNNPTCYSSCDIIAWQFERLNRFISPKLWYQHVKIPGAVIPFNFHHCENLKSCIAHKNITCSKQSNDMYHVL
jgi:hypothetical protein